MTTPEQRLLKVIEQPHLAGPPLVAKPPAGGTPLAKGTERAQAWLRRHHVAPDLNTINRALMVLCGMVTVAVLVDYARVQQQFARRYERLAQAAEAPADAIAPAEPPAEALSEAAFLADVSKRNIFTLIPASAAAAAQTGAELVGRLKLVGILWSSSPQAMLEDTKENKTHLVSEGDTLDQFTIKKIFKDKVTIESGTQQLELR